MIYIRFVTAFSIMLAIFAMPTHSFSETNSSSVTEVLQFRSLEAGSTEPLNASLKGANRFTIAWRLQETASELSFAKDSTAYYRTEGLVRAVLPSGERIALSGASQIIDVLKHVPTGVVMKDGTVTKQGSHGNLWSYSLSEGRRILPESFQSDVMGNLYFQDDARDWYSLDVIGQERYVLQLNAQDSGTVCRVAPSGDAICASSVLGLIGIREKTTAPRLMINGKEQFFSQRPEVMNGITFVPFRSIFEALKVDVSWNKKSHKVEAIKGMRKIRLTLGSKEALINGKKVHLDHPPLLKNGTTFVPLRFVGEALGETVIWEGETSAIQIVTSS